MSRGETLLQGQVEERWEEPVKEGQEEGEDTLQSPCEQRLTWAGLFPDINQGTAKHQPLSFSHKPARASSPITKAATIRGATRSQGGSESQDQ